MRTNEYCAPEHKRHNPMGLMQQTAIIIALGITSRRHRSYKDVPIPIVGKCGYILREIYKIVRAMRIDEIMYQKPRTIIEHTEVYEMMNNLFRHKEYTVKELKTTLFYYNYYLLDLADEYTKGDIDALYAILAVKIFYMPKEWINDRTLEAKCNYNIANHRRWMARIAEELGMCNAITYMSQQMYASLMEKKRYTGLTTQSIYTKHESRK
jgi:hypothetical protein